MFSTKCWSSFNVSRYIFFQSSTNKLVAVTFDVIDGAQHFTTAACLPRVHSIFQFSYKAIVCLRFNSSNYCGPNLRFFLLIPQFYIAFLLSNIIFAPAVSASSHLVIKQKHTEVRRFIDDDLNKTDWGFGFIARLQQVPIAPFRSPYRDTYVQILIYTADFRQQSLTTLINTHVQSIRLIN